MKKFLASISLLFLSLSVFCQNNIGKLTIDDGQTRQYNAEISFRGKGLTGICLLQSDGRQLLGSMINEFGIKAMDFTYNAVTHNVRLLNVVKFLDKWYIRKVIKSDLSYIFSATDDHKDKHRNITLGSDGSLLMENTKYKITYSLTPITDDTQE